MTMALSELTYLTPPEVASVVRVAPSTVRRWLLSGQLKGCRVGKVWRIELDDLYSFLGRSQLDEAVDRVLEFMATQQLPDSICPACASHRIDPSSQFGWCAGCSTDRQIEIDAANEREKARKLRWWDANGKQWRDGRKTKATADDG